jgi:hypothetical protein
MAEVPSCGTEIDAAGEIVSRQLGTKKGSFAEAAFRPSRQAGFAGHGPPYN